MRSYAFKQNELDFCYLFRVPRTNEQSASHLCVVRMEFSVAVAVQKKLS